MKFFVVYTFDKVISKLWTWDCWLDNMWVGQLPLNWNPHQVVSETFYVKIMSSSCLTHLHGFCLYLPTLSLSRTFCSGVGVHSGYNRFRSVNHVNLLIMSPSLADWFTLVCRFNLNYCSTCISVYLTLIVAKLKKTSTFSLLI